MRTIISGDITIINAEPEVVEWIESNLTLANPVYVNLIKRGQQQTIKRKHVPERIKSFSVRNGCYTVPFGCLSALWPYIKEHEWELDFAPEHRTSFGSMACSVDLMDYQEEAVQRLLSAKCGVLKAGCGSGKTYIGIEVLRRLGLRFLWLCGKSDLLNQTYDNFKKLYPDLDIGLITEGEVHMGKDGTIATVQTLINVDYRLYENEFNAVVLDECHAMTSTPTTRQMYAKVFARCKARYKYGLTATPARQDGTTKLIYANIGMSPKGTFRPTYEVRDSQTQSLVAKYSTFELETPSSYCYLGTDGTIDFNALLNYLAENGERNEAICSEVARLVMEEGRKVALLSYRREHVYALEGVLKGLGVSCGTITGTTSKKDRRGVLGDVDSWDVIISTVHLFKEGLDIKALDTIFIALPFKDPTGIQQSEGRAERPLEGKNEPLFVFGFDHRIPYCEAVERKMRRIVNRKRR